MCKNRRLSLAVVVAISLVISAGANGQQHGSETESSQAPASVSIRQNNIALCGQEFYDNFYALTLSVFAVGAANVSTEEYTRRVFSLVRSSQEFAGETEAFVDHIKDIPGQLLQIIREDPAVLDSCANFSVALVGPP